MSNNEFNILNEIDEVQDIDEAMDVSAFYASSASTEPQSEERVTKLEEVAHKPDLTIKARKPTPWVPKQEILDSLPETQTLGAVYEQGEIIESRGTPINGADEQNINDGNTKIADLQRQINNIEEAKARHHIKYLKIPEGELQTRFHIAAEDTDYQRAQATLDELLDMVEQQYPYMIYARTDDYVPETVTTVDNATGETITVPAETPSHPELTEDEMKAGDVVQIIIDKLNATQLAWTEEEMEKIRRSRTIELKIVESKTLSLGNIEDVEDDAIDSVLAAYENTVNEVSAALPASHYRATFTGLTYAEIIELSTAVEMDNYDGEQKKWSIAFNHLKNQSIGPWEEYKIYIDPVTRKQVKTSMNAIIPPEVLPNDIHTVTKFEDFMKKTSFMDLEFILWKVLCATTMDKELVTIKCKTCNHSYDFMYHPASLLQVDKISQSTLDEIKAIATADSEQKIKDLYMEGPVSNSNYIDLPASKYRVIYGHASAYEYMNSIYSKIRELEDTEDPEIISKSFSYMMLPTIKGVLLPAENGWKRIKGTDNILKVIATLNEVDYRAISEISRLAREPYIMEYAIKDATCPKCGSKSDIQIDNIATLLFIVARSLASANITLSSK